MTFSTRKPPLGKFSVLALSGASVLILAGCAQGAFGPSPIPTGYFYHHRQYQAPTGAEPVGKSWSEWLHGNRASPVTEGEERDMSQMAPAFENVETSLPPLASGGASGSMDLWRQAAGDLVARIISQYGYPSRPIRIESTGPVSSEFEAGLRAAMQEKNWPIAPANDPNPILFTYNVMPAGDHETSGVLIDVVIRNASVPIQLSGTYDVGATGLPMAMPAHAGLAVLPRGESVPAKVSVNAEALPSSSGEQMSAMELLRSKHGKPSGSASPTPPLSGGADEPPMMLSPLQ